MYPPIINESLVQRFKFWCNGIQDGMRYREDLYAPVRSYSGECRLQAYELACQLSQQGTVTCITCADSSYTVWSGLRSSIA